MFFKDEWIHSRETDLPLETNFGKGGMKALVEGLAKEQANVKVKRRTYGIGVVFDCASVNIDVPNRYDVVWARAMKLAEEKELTKDKLHFAGSSIWDAIGWDDPVNSLSVHAYIARNQHKALMEEK